MSWDDYDRVLAANEGRDQLTGKNESTTTRANRYRARKYIQERTKKFRAAGLNSRGKPLKKKI